jgi:RHS repeat-associated protein
LHYDSLNSVDTITNNLGVVEERFAYKPFGQRLALDKNGYPSSKTPQTNRGFTGHEHIEESDLINMNARLYDSAIGRFLSADTMIPYMYNTQSFNRYSYVRNNPLKYIDPSGHWGFSSITKAFKKVVNVVKKYAKVIVIAVAAYYTGGAALAWMGTTAATAGVGAMMVAGAAGGFVAGALSTKLNGGSWSQALSSGVKGAVVGAVSAGAAYGVAEGTASVFNLKDSAIAHSSSFFNGAGGYGMAAFKAVAHGISRALIAKAQNQRMSSAFWSGFTASGFSVGTKGYGGVSGRTAIMAVVGGTVSQITGGKFANGAVTGAFVHLFNAENFGQKIMNKLTQGYYKLTGTALGRIAISGATGTVGGAIKGYEYCGTRCVVPGAVLGTGGGLIVGTTLEATGYNISRITKMRVAREISDKAGDMVREYNE